MKRPITTLFMLTSLDGKISTGASDDLDMDRDFPLIKGVREGLNQYYEIEQTTDLWSLNSGRVQAKMGVNGKQFPESRSPVSFVLIDNTHLTWRGAEYFSRLSDRFVLATSNPAHPAFEINSENTSVLFYEKFSAARLLDDLGERFGCQRLTIQTGGTLNCLFLREGLIDFVDIVVAPALVGGSATPTLIDGASVMSRGELGAVRALKLESARVLENSYLRLRYSVL